MVSGFFAVSQLGLVCDCGYLSLDNFAAVEADPDAGPTL
jgi:hypothetical protein